MPVVPWDGQPFFGGKTLVLPGSAIARYAGGGSPGNA